VKPIWILLKQETVSGSGISWAICNAYRYSLRLPAGNTWVHLIPHSTHPQSSSLHGTVKAGSCSKIQKRAVPPPCFACFNFQSTRSQGALAPTAATSAFIGLTVHQARSDAVKQKTINLFSKTLCDFMLHKY